MKLRPLRDLAIGCALALACTSRDTAERAPTGPVEAHDVERASLRFIALDTLSDSARILALIPEPDGDAVAFTFADPARAITAGLGILDRARPIPQLVWPDSTTQVRWRGSHELVFSAGTGESVLVVVDAHADTISAIQDPSDSAKVPTPDALTAATTSAELPANARARATRFVDSLRFQPDGKPQGSALRYAPTRIALARHDSLAAFHVLASDDSGRQFNPAWYLLDLRTADIQPIDTVVGPASAMRSESAAWTEDGAFLYTKGLTVHEVRVRRIQR
jgi:hypothetical protein